MGSELTPKQKKLMKELDSIYSVIGMDYWEIGKHPEEDWTGMLEFQKRRVITGDIIGRYTLVSELVDALICIYFFRLGECQVQWGSEKLEKFNEYILEGRSLLQKFRIINGVYDIPANIKRDVERLNKVRNVVAHKCLSGVPGDWSGELKATYRGKDIFNLEAIKMLKEDTDNIVNYLTNMELD